MTWAFASSALTISSSHVDDESTHRDVDSVIITDELDRRPSRAPDYEAENRALALLAEVMGNEPFAVLQRLVEVAMELTGSDSAGISLLEPGGENGMFRWVAATGAFADNLNGTMARKASPCGEVIVRDAVILFNEAERVFPALLDAEPKIYENLLAPFHLDGKPAGTLWAIKHAPEGRFEAEDARLLRRLAGFAAAAHSMTAALQDARARARETELTLRQREQAEDALRESEARLARELEATRILQNISNQLMSKPGVDGHFDELCGAARALMRSDCASIQVLDEASSRLKLAGYVGFHPDSAAFWEWVDAGVGSACGQALASGERVILPDVDRFEADPPELDAFRRSSILSVQSTPLVARTGEIVGMMSTHWHRRDAIAEARYRYFDILTRLAADFIVRIRAETALRESEEKYRTLYTSMGQGYIEVELIRDASGNATDYRYVVLNPAYERLTGIPVDKAVGRPSLEVIPDLSSFWAETFQRIVDNQTAEEFEYEEKALDRWYGIYAYPVGGDRLTVLALDITQRKKAEQALRESEERYRALFESMDEAYAVVDVLKDEAGAWVDFRFVEVNPAFIEHTSMPWPVGKTATELLGTPNPRWTQLYGQALDTGQPIRVEEAEPTLDRVFDLNIFALDPVRNRVAVLFTNITERKRAEAALRESEERFRQFANASAAGLWIRDADSLSMEFVSAAVGTIYGVEPDALLGDVKRWAAMIVPEDREGALDHLQHARRGETVAHEFRIQRSTDGAFRWIRNTDFPLRDNGNIPRIGGIAEDVTETKLAVEHQGVLLAELQHRVRNIMAMIRSMARRSSDGAADVAEYKDMLEGRLLALARVQALLTRQANAGGTLRDIVESEVAAQAQGGGQYELVGPDIQLSPKAVEVLTLALHELATNALKYGALSVPEGRLRVEWAPFEKRGRTWLAIDWTEEGAPSRGPVTRRGLGSDLIEGKIPYELGGTGRISIEPGGARCRLEFPLKEGESILETDAPSPTTVFGGTLDMTGAPDLTGRSVLVVEDDYYIAGDTAAALRGAGATVLGPCPSVDATLDLLETATPTHAILDLNLGGGGPRFEIAHALKERGVPFIFLTGYDTDAVPPDLADIVRLQKPAPLISIVEAVAHL
jgi:PAS domain S-box-containing protein